MLAVVDSGVANLTSVMAALQRLGAEATVTAEAAVIAGAERIILPGVGSAGAAMARLREKKLEDVLKGLTQPVLGICLGMQIMFESSAEGGACLGIMPGRVEKLPSLPSMPVPHMGWNQIRQCRSALLEGIEEGSYVYFVHSYAAPVGDVTLAVTDYSAAFSAAVGRGNFFGCQFHPERSGAVGGRILGNFLRV